MASERLQEAHLRVARALQHKASVEQAFLALPDDRREIRFDQHFDPSENKIVVSIGSVPTWPDAWALSISEAFFNLRAALDYVAWELRDWNLEQRNDPGSPGSAKRVQFPIALTPDEFDNKCATQHQDFAPEHREYIRSLQPFGSEFEDFSRSRISNPDLSAEVVNAIVASDRERHPLYRLKVMNDEDKHRFLKPTLWDSRETLIRGAVDKDDCLVTKTNYFMQVAYSPGNKWAEFTVEPTGPNPRVTLQDVVRPSIGWGDADALLSIGITASFVSTRVLAHFDAFFENEEA